MAATSGLGFQYPGPNDPADMNYWNQLLAAGVEAEFNKRAIYGEHTIGNYTKNSTGFIALPLTQGITGPIQTGIVRYSDGFSLPAGHWEVGYELSFGTSSPGPGSGVTSEHQAWITLAGTEVGFTHSYQGNGGNRAGHLSGRTAFQVGSDNPRVRLFFGSPDSGSYIVPNGGKLWYRRIA